MKTALVTGIAGQDGSYLAEYLLREGYEVHGICRLAQNQMLVYQNLVNVLDRISFHVADLRDEVALEKVIRRVHPQEIYNLAGQTFVPASWTHPAETMDVNVGGLARILKTVEAVDRKIRVYQASSSEMFGNIRCAEGEEAVQIPRCETSSMEPASPYGASKLAAHKLVDAYRQRGLYVVSGILFNHESPRRGREMVTRKITRQMANWVVHGIQSPLLLGSVKSKRDWGYAGEYVEAMHTMLQQEQPDDYVVGTGEAHSVLDFLQQATQAAGLADRVLPVKYDVAEFQRKDDLHCLVANAKKAEAKWGWKAKVRFGELVGMMVQSDITAVKHAAELRDRVVR